MAKTDYTLLSRPEIYKEKVKEVKVKMDNLKKHGVKLLLRDGETARIVGAKLKKLAPRFHLTADQFMRLAKNSGLELHIREGGNGLKFKLSKKAKIDTTLSLAKKMAKKLGISVKELYSKLRVTE